MGLAQRPGPNVWHVRQDFDNVLRAMQRSADRQKTLAAHGVLKSDERLPMAVLNLRRLTTLEGRILVHGEEETVVRPDAVTSCWKERTGGSTTSPTRRKWKRHGATGGLRTNSFIRLRKLNIEGRPAMEIDDMGDSEAILRNKRYLGETAQRLIRRAVVPQEDGWNGWLGRYQKALCETAMTPDPHHHTNEPKRDKSRDHGR